MANLLKLEGDRAELPHRGLQFSLTLPQAKLQAGLTAFRDLAGDPELRLLPERERRETIAFLRQLGRLLYATIFPDGHDAVLEGRGTLLLQPDSIWAEYPWELLHDGQEWLGLSWGIARLTAPPTGTMAPRRRTGTPLRALGVTASPLGRSPAAGSYPGAAASGTSLHAQMETLSPRLLSPLPTFLHSAAGSGADSGASGGTESGHEPDVLWRLLEHASRAQLDAALSRDPEALFFSGWSGEEGLFLEGEDHNAVPAMWPWLIDRLRLASRRGLGLLVLNDSLPYHDPVEARRRTAQLIGTGLDAVIRLRGSLGRTQEQDWLRTLLRHVAAGMSLPEAHLTAVRRLQRRNVDDWAWCFPRLYLRALPSRGEYLLSATHERETDRTHLSSSPRAASSAGSGSTSSQHGGPAPRPYATPPSPPIFRAQRRHHDRVELLRGLTTALQPGAPAASPLVYLQGPAGSGKTWTALEAARRLRSRYAQVLHLTDRDLLPEPTAVLHPAHLSDGPPPAQAPLMAAVARHFHADPPAEDSTQAWQRALIERCADGQPRLLILDRLEHHANYEATCTALAALPMHCRVLLLGRKPAPLKPGAKLQVEPSTDRDLALICGESLLERLRLLPDGGAVLERLREDLLPARLLKGLPEWPASSAIEQALTPASNNASRSGAAAPQAATQEQAAPGQALAELLVQHGWPLLDDETATAAAPLALLPSLVHREVIAQVTGMEPARLSLALGRLVALGWADAYEGERYYALHPRLHSLLGRRLLDSTALQWLHPALLRVYRAFLARVGALLEAPDNAWRHHPPPLLAWCDERTETHPAGRVRLLHRLGRERVNLAELALLLADQGDWVGLEQLAEEAKPLERLPEMSDLSALLGHCLLAGAESRSDPVRKAEALNRLAVPLMGDGRALDARPLLEQALHLLSTTAAWPVLGATYRNLSRCCQALGQLDAAQNLLYSAVELARQLSSAGDLVLACEALAPIWRQRGGDIAQAERFLRGQAHTLTHWGAGQEAAAVLRVLGSLLCHAGRGEDALNLLQDMLSGDQSLDHPEATASTKLGLAECHAALGQPGEALGAWRAAAGNNTPYATSDRMGHTLADICGLFEVQERPREALEGYLEMRRLLEAMGDREALIGVLDRIGGLYFQLGERAESTRCYQERLHLQSAMAPG